MPSRHTEDLIHAVLYVVGTYWFMEALWYLLH